MKQAVAEVEVRGSVVPGQEAVLTSGALAFVARMHERFDGRRRRLLDDRTARRRRIARGELPDFPESTADIREGSWQVSPVPSALRDRRVEITGPPDRKMVINALSSGAQAYMADFEDATSPTWSNCLLGQLNLMDAARGTIEHVGDDGRIYRLGEHVASLMVRPRGWHLVDRHVLVDGEMVSGTLLDFGLYVFHNHEPLAWRGRGPWLYLPKLESRMEARLWSDVLAFAEDELGLERGTIRATVLVETVLAAFEMDEILYELRDHAAGLNAGRWDYLFSIIKQLGGHREFVLPDRSLLTMDAPFMRSYAELLVATCHRRGTHAIGGMAAFIPSRRDGQANRRAIEAVRSDKRREAEAGFDGTWVAHPDLVPIAREQFDAVLRGRPNQLDRLRDDVNVGARELLDIAIEGGSITEDGLRMNIGVGIEYIAWWLGGRGAAAINNLMEDAATAEISRSQVWQWMHHGARLEDGRLVDRNLVSRIIDDELGAALERLGAEGYVAWRMDEAASIFREVACTGSDLVDFLTIPAYERLRD